LFLLTEVKGASDNNPQIWLNKFQEIWLKGNATAKAGSPTEQQTSKPTPKPATGSRLRLRLVVRTDEPILVAKRAEAGNEFEALNSIPGTAVRGAFAEMAAKALARYGDEMRGNFMKLFFSELVRFSPLYPAAQDRAHLRPAFPAPLDFQTCKLHPGFKAYGAGVLKHYKQEVKECLRCKEAKIKADLASLYQYIYVAQQDKLKQAEVKQRLEMHNTINPYTERVLTTNLFAYEPLASAQFFMGEIFCADENLWHLLIDMAGLQPIGKSFALHLGKASRRGYGRATAVVQKMPVDGPPLWIGQGIRERINNLQAHLVLTLMSDTIIPDCWGRFHTGFEEEWLAKELGTPVKIEEQFVNAREIDSFNAHLGLPRWRDIALTAGSSVLLQPVGQWNVARLEQLEREGLGLRRNEGFGWVAFNHPIYFNPAALHDWQFKLDEDLKLGNALDSHRFSLEDTFREAWVEALKKLHFDKCRKQPFIAAARLLRTEKNSSSTDLKNRLERLGRRENLDKTLPPNENVWFDKEGKGKEGKKQILDALDELEKILPNHGEDENQRKELAAIGIEMLAELIAEEANQDERSDKR
jgi:CRISPR-associated protein Csx10